MTHNCKENLEALESDRDYFKHFSRLHERRAKASWKLLHQLERLLECNEVDKARKQILDYLDA